MQLNIREIADKADMIINGYAFTNENGWIRVLNLNHPERASVIFKDQIIETNTDDIENAIILNYYQNNKDFMEI